MDKLITVLVQTSPLPSHPSTALLEALFRSFDRVHGLKECNIIILCDGCEDEEEPIVPGVAPGPTETKEDREGVKSTKRKSKTNYKHGTVSQETAQKYRLHLEYLSEKLSGQEPPFKPMGNGSIRILNLPYRHGSAKAIAAAFKILSIQTPYVLIAQHDNFFVHDVPYFKQLIQYMEMEDIRSWLQCVHFPSTATLNYVEKIQRRYCVNLEQFCKPAGQCVGSDQEEVTSLHGKFIPLVFWYGRTHVARTSYYTEKILSDFPLKVGDHLEEIFGISWMEFLSNMILPVMAAFIVNAALSPLELFPGSSGKLDCFGIVFS